VGVSLSLVFLMAASISMVMTLHCGRPRSIAFDTLHAGAFELWGILLDERFQLVVTGARRDIADAKLHSSTTL
jgi:hypothetical protein